MVNSVVGGEDKRRLVSARLTRALCWLHAALGFSPTSAPDPDEELEGGSPAGTSVHIVDRFPPRCPGAVGALNDCFTEQNRRMMIRFEAV